MRALVVEDNFALADGIATALRGMGLAVDVLHDGLEADQVLQHPDCDLLVLDLGLPGKDGIDILRDLRARGHRLQVLVLTARDSVDDRVRGLDVGADDYLTKPFDLKELEARARALLRRQHNRQMPVWQLGDLSFDTIARRARIGEMDLELPKRETCLLELFMAKAGQVISKEQIADSLADFDSDITPNAVETWVSRLRKKLKPSSVSIKTIRGLGYLMEKPL